MNRRDGGNASCHPSRMPFPSPERPLPATIFPPMRVSSIGRTIARPGACQDGFTNNQSLTPGFNNLRGWCFVPLKAGLQPCLFRSLSCHPVLLVILRSALLADRRIYEIAGSICAADKVHRSFSAKRRRFRMTVCCEVRASIHEAFRHPQNPVVSRLPLVLSYLSFPLSSRSALLRTEGSMESPEVFDAADKVHRSFSAKRRRFWMTVFREVGASG